MCGNRAEVFLNKKTTGYNVSIQEKIGKVIIQKGNIKMFDFNNVDFYCSKNLYDMCENLIEKISSFFQSNRNKTFELSNNGTIKNKAIGKVTFNTGDICQGNSFTDLVNNIFNTNYKRYQQSTVNLKSFGLEGSLAWIVFINGEPHGYYPDLWTNSIFSDGTIEEKYVGTDPNKFRQEFIHKRYRSFCNKMVFQKDPYNTGDEHTAKFLGYYKIKYYDIDTLTRVWEKISDSVTLWL